MSAADLDVTADSAAHLNATDRAAATDADDGWRPPYVGWWPSPYEALPPTRDEIAYDAALDGAWDR